MTYEPNLKQAREWQALVDDARALWASVPDYARDTSKAEPVGTTELRFSDERA
jgi:hypothetical protein